MYWFILFYTFAAMVKAQPVILGPFVLIYALQHPVVRDDSGALCVKRCAQHIAARLMAPAAQFVASVGKVDGVCHIIDAYGKAWFFVPYGTDRGWFTSANDCTLGTACTAFLPTT